MCVCVGSTVLSSPHEYSCDDLGFYPQRYETQLLQMSYLIFPRIPCGIDMIGYYEIQIFFKNNPDHIIATIKPSMLPGINQYTNARVLLSDDGEGDDIGWRVISKKNGRIIDIKLDTPELKDVSTTSKQIIVSKQVNVSKQQQRIENLVLQRLAQKHTAEQLELHKIMLYRVTRHGSTSHDSTRHDSTRHDSTSHDSTSHDSTNHDSTSHDSTSHDSTRHDSTNNQTSVSRTQNNNNNGERLY